MDFFKVESLSSRVYLDHGTYKAATRLLTSTLNPVLWYLHLIILSPMII